MTDNILPRNTSEKFKGWGHSTWEQAAEVALLANVKNLSLPIMILIIMMIFLTLWRRSAKKFFLTPYLQEKEWKFQFVKLS